MQRPGRGKTMTAKSSKKKVAAAPGERVVSENRKARHNYTVLDTLECGLLLVGSEVKSLREGKVSLGRGLRPGEGRRGLAGGLRHPRVHRRQPFQSSPQAAAETPLAPPRDQAVRPSGLREGVNIDPAEMYFKRGIAKVLMGVCRGKQLHDKRQAMKKAEAQRNIQRQMLEGGRGRGPGTRGSGTLAVSQGHTFPPMTGFLLHRPARTILPRFA